MAAFTQCEFSYEFTRSELHKKPLELPRAWNVHTCSRFQQVGMKMDPVSKGVGIVCGLIAEKLIQKMKTKNRKKRL